MISEISKKWIEAGKQAAAHPDAKILCPVCGQDILNIEDIKYESDPSRIERIMACPSCFSRNILRMRV